MNDSKLMNRAADNIRILAASMVEKANSGHPGGAMGGADFVNVLFSEFLVYDPQNPRWEGRDRFFLDPGHMSPMLYSVLAFTGKYTLDELKQFRQWGSPTPGHPEVNVDRGVENTSGPLGQGHTYAVAQPLQPNPESPLWRSNEPDYLRIYIRWRYPGRNLSGCRPHCRYTRTGQPDHVLRFKRRTAFYQHRRCNNGKRSHEI